MKFAVALCAVAALLPAALGKYSPTQGDHKRDAVFADCHKNFGFVKNVTKVNTLRDRDNMETCSEACQDKLHNSAYGQYLKCFTCCDAYYGRTPESARALPVPPTQVVGVNFPGFRGIYCKDVMIPHPFSSSVRSENIVALVGATHRNWGFKYSGSHDAITGWVQYVKNDRVRVCAAETGRHNNHHDNNVRMEVVIMERNIRSKTQVGYEKYPRKWSGELCVDVKFREEFKKIPAVIVNPSHRHHTGTNPHEATVHWVKGKSTKGFTVCARNRRGFGSAHDRIGFEWMATPKRIATTDGYYIAGSTDGAKWKHMNSQHWCQRVSFPSKLHVPKGQSPQRAYVLTNPISGSPVAAWGEGGNADGFDLCVAPAGGQESKFKISQVSVDWFAVSAHPNVKGRVPKSCKGLNDGFHDLDLDNDDGTVAQRMYCQGQKVVLAKFYNTGENDFPDDIKYVHSGWRKLASGKWSTVPTLIDPRSSVSQAMPVKFVEHLMKKRGWKNIHMCFVGTNHVPRECRTMYVSGNPGASPTGASIDKYNSMSSKNNYAAWIYGRLAGLPFSRDACYSIQRRDPHRRCNQHSGCIRRHGGSYNAFGNQSPGLCEHSGGSGWDGVWHGWGHGMSFRPADKDAYELGNGWGNNPGGNAGFILYLQHD